MGALGRKIGRGSFSNAGLEYEIAVYQNGKLHTAVAHRKGILVALSEQNVIEPNGGVTVNDLIRQVQDEIRSKR